MNLGSLDDVLSLLKSAPPPVVAQLEKEIEEDIKVRPWVPNPGPQTEAYFCEADEVFYGGQAGGGKLLNIKEILPTPTGFVRMGDVKIGDVLFDAEGKQCRVVATSEVKLSHDAYEVVFSDGSVIEADAGHLWHTYTEADRDQLRSCTEAWRERRKAKRPSRAKQDSQKPWVSASITRTNQERQHKIKVPTGSVKTTEEIRRTLYTKRGATNHSIPLAKPLETAHVDLPIEPYLLGLWLGDGISNANRIGMLDADWEHILPHIERGITRIKRRDLKGTHRLPYTEYSFDLLRCDLQDLGIFGSGMKRIPPVYLRASIEQRRELLRGLLDTDGYCSLSGSIELGLSKRDLLEDAYELVCSLGMQATITTRQLSQKNGKHNDSHRIKFLAPFPAFKLPRKLARQKLDGFRSTTTNRYIVDVRPIPPVKMRCIGIDSPSHLYLAGRSMVPTHNTDLMLGLALTEHRRSLVLRRTNKEVNGLVERMSAILGSRDGFNSQTGMWRRPDGRTIELGGCQLEEDRQKYKGIPHDLICWDEVSDFTESQYLFVNGWNRSAIPGQRCRVVAAGNPPTKPEGLWVLTRWAAWLDPQHPNPAKPGELRWYTTDPLGHEVEVNGYGPHYLQGEVCYARSRTFIPATLADNPDLKDTNYKSVLDSLPAELRAAYRDGNFGAALTDDPYQIIPTDWVEAAMRRWHPAPPPGIPMCALGVDVAIKKDNYVVAPRFDGWFAKLEVIPGAEIADPKKAAGRVVALRRDNATVIVDVGGGWGADCYAQLLANGIDVVSYMGVKATKHRSTDGKFHFTNVRTEALWTFREALDPSQPGGSTIMLPPDSTLKADLCAPHYKVKPHDKGMLLAAESKEEIVKRLGRSTDRGDAVIMSWHKGVRQSNMKNGWEHGRLNRAPVVNRGRKH